MNLQSVTLRILLVLWFVAASPDVHAQQNSPQSDQPVTFGQGEVRPPVDADVPILKESAPKAKADASTSDAKDPDSIREMEELREVGKPDFVSMFFDPLKNEIRYTRQVIDYDLTNPLTLRVGPFNFLASSVSLALSREWISQQGEWLPMSQGPEGQYILSFQWPVEYIPEGVMELLADDGRTLWAKRVGPYERGKWDQFLKKLTTYQLDPKQKEVNPSGQAPVKAPSNQRRYTVHNRSSYGLWGYEFLEVPVWKIKTPFRFCMSKDTEVGRTAFCSKRYRFYRRGGRYYLKSSSRSVRPRVLINNKPVTLKGSAVFVSDDTPTKFSALMSNGTYYEFVSNPLPVRIIDVVKNKKTQKIEVMGYGTPPMGEVRIVDKRSNDFWEFLNFMPTIGDFREFWRAEMSSEDSYLFLRGEGGAPFKQTFLFDEVPSKSARPKLTKRSPETTYSETVILDGEVEKGLNVSSDQKSAKMISETEFEWDFYAPQKGEMNRSYLKVIEGDKEWQAMHEVYRGYSSELALRATGVLTTDLELVLLGEVAYQQWFEDIFNIRSYYYTRQRWGFAVKYFQAFASVGGDRSNGRDLIELQVITGDVKYRLTPGIWGRDQSIGLIWNTQSVLLEGTSALMTGGGVFWARSMPKILDDIFNIIPFLEYPKWVDAEFLFYFLPLDGQTQLGANFAMNFHGKIEWTKQFYGEGGFGLKIFQYNDLNVRKRAALGVAYGTVGLGYNF